ncbi:MAG: hypothetical protein QOD41_1572 [Cryptosporangiaceae bacterium]|nr:hypothetical protein [Cryptosporangiaceae bacterium]
MPALAAAAVLASVAACAPPSSGSLGPAPDAGLVTPASATPAPTPGTAAAGQAAVARTGPTASPRSRPRLLRFEVWLARGSRLFAAARERPTEITTGRLALGALADGMTAAEARAGVRTAIAPGSQFGLSLAGGVATVDPPASFYAGSPQAVRMRQAQVVFTLTQYPTVSSVVFRAGGSVRTPRLTRSAYAALLPPIVVTAPAVGAAVSSPVLISGTAAVYESTVSVRILTTDGSEIATRFTSATAGSGARGVYSVALPYQVSGPQPGIVEVFEVSARDGARLNAVRIPVTLSP